VIIYQEKEVHIHHHDHGLLVIHTRHHHLLHHHGVHRHPHEVLVIVVHEVVAGKKILTILLKNV
jgi:hypothetical protein